MSGNLNIRDTQILRDMQAAISHFGERASSTIESVSRELQQVQEKINQRVYYWERQVERAYQAVQQAESALRRCEASGYRDSEGRYHQPDCSRESHELQVAQRFLRECQQNLNKTKEWRSRVEQGAHAYYSEAKGFLHSLSSTSQKASQYLGNAADRYEAVHQSSGIFGGIAGMGGLAHASSSAPDEFGKTIFVGPYATDSIPARGPERDFTTAEHNEIDRIGYASGCHTCGSKDPGTEKGHFCVDHQPPTILNFHNAPQSLYPQCASCSSKQGGESRSLKDTLFKFIYFRSLYRF